MIAPAPQSKPTAVEGSQPGTAELRQHTPTPWDEPKLSSVDDDLLFVKDGSNWDLFTIRISHSSSPATAKANAAFIVEAVNSHATLQARVEELERILREARRFIDPDCDPSALTNRALTLQINRALGISLEDQK